jgi:hypothetical protein
MFGELRTHESAGQHSQCGTVNYLADCRQLQALQMMRLVHPLMKDANNRDTVVGDAEINHMPLDIAAAVDPSNMITRWSGLRRFGQDLECRGQQVGVSLSLLLSSSLRIGGCREQKANSQGFARSERRNADPMPA